jgi:hypothetical protein
MAIKNGRKKEAKNGINKSRTLAHLMRDALLNRLACKPLKYYIEFVNIYI